MGMLVEGVWKDVWYDTKETKGHFKRSASQFRNWITADGAPGPSGEGGFEAEKDRYHLYVSFACPWAHRTLIFRKLKKLEDLISVSVVDPLMLENGWEFKPEGERTPGATEDHLFGSSALWQVYTKADPKYSGRVTVPVLWDKKRGTIVSNESARGLMDLGVRSGLCIGNGVLTVENEEQALVRASTAGGDKGGDAARACLALINYRTKLGL